jgi:hypothetical protein
VCYFPALVSASIVRSCKGGKVTSRKQAIAIGLSEAREKGAKVPKKKAAPSHWFRKLPSMPMVKRSSTRVLYVAIAANIAIALSKYAAAAITGSSAMLAGAFHSITDSCNELRLIFGIKRSARPRVSGHGKEIYSWSLVVAIVIWLGWRILPARMEFPGSRIRRRPRSRLGIGSFSE